MAGNGWEEVEAMDVMESSWERGRFELDGCWTGLLERVSVEFLLCLLELGGDALRVRGDLVGLWRGEVLTLLVGVVTWG
jgi:hypothetical protein